MQVVPGGGPACANLELIRTTPLLAVSQAYAWDEAMSPRVEPVILGGSEEPLLVKI